MRLLALPTLTLVGLVVLASCGSSTGDEEQPMTSLEPGMQSVSYAIGMDMGRNVGTMPAGDDHVQLVSGMRERLADNAKVPEEIAFEIIQHPPAMEEQDAAFTDPHFASDNARRSYAMGVVLATMAQNQVPGLDGKALAQGLSDMLAGRETLIPADQVQAVIGEFQQEQQKVMQEQHAAMTATNRAEGEAFLVANAQRDEVKVTPSGLQYEVLRDAEGARPLADSTVKVHYRGTLLDGTQFDSSYDRGEPISFNLQRVIPGWTEGVQLMPIGSKYKFFIPGNLAYGERGAGADIGPNATLIFDVELLEILD